MDGSVLGYGRYVYIGIVGICMYGGWVDIGVALSLVCVCVCSRAREIYISREYDNDGG